jgi:hypothetical protein
MSFVMNSDSIKGQVGCMQTITVRVEAPSLEKSNFSW